MRQRRWIKLFSDYDCKIRYHPVLSKSSLAAQNEAISGENEPAEMTCGLDEQMERKGDGGVAEGVGNTARYEYSLSPSNGWTKYTIQTLEDMLKACAIDFGGSWDTHLPLAEFYYNNSYHSSIRCAPFEALYRRKCRSLVLWDEVRENRLISPEMVQETTDKVVIIKERLKAARYHQKSYADNRQKALEFEVGDRVLLKVSPWKGATQFGKKGKLAPRYVGPFEIIERIGSVAY
ncbi:putative reverse transcriptase domain-containing protein [Tanacetum coccineum]